MIVNLQGGMGNQMFQYAYGMKQARLRGEPLYINISQLNGHPPREFSLGAWINPRFTDQPGEQGYWQAEKYFDPIQTKLEFEYPRGIPNKACRYFAERIHDNAFLGIRRADYLWPERVGFHGVMPLEYYQEAISLLPTKVPIFIFTDDPEWALCNFKDFPIVYANGPEEKAWDIWLMSLARYAIIANSTFHWWGAYLGRKKKVIAPKQWFRDPVKNSRCEIIPEGWIRI